MEETETRTRMKNMAENAFLGSGKVKISSVATTFKMSFRDYNPGRIVNQQVLTQMVQAMKSGRCFAESNPLIVAIDPKDINTELLVDKYKSLSDLRSICSIAGHQVKMHVLNGMHRAYAAREVSDILRGFRSEQEGLVIRHHEFLDEEDVTDRAQVEKDLAILEKWLAVVKDVIELVETWPVNVYDKSESGPSRSRFSSTEAIER